jgi:hypothetical protein
MKTVNYGGALTILKTDEAYCGAECTFYIGITGDVGSTYEIRASTDESYQMLIDGSSVTGRISGESYKYYETFANIDGNFSVILESCTGNSDLYVSQETYKPTVKKHNWMSASKTEVDSITISDEDKAHVGFYIGVYGEDTEAAYNDFKLTVNIAEDPAKKPIPGNDGLLNVMVDPENPSYIIVSFEGATSTEYDSLTYSVYYHFQDDDVNMYSMCGCERALFGGRFTSTDSTAQHTLTLKNLHYETTYKFNVVANDEDGRYGLYTATQGFVTLSAPGMDWTEILLWVGIPLVIILVVGMIYMTIKNRSLTKELEIEMEDVPSRAVRKAMRGPPTARATNTGKKAKNYAQLLTEDDDVEDDYAPPDF